MKNYRFVTTLFLLFVSLLYSIDITEYTFSSCPQEANVMFLNPANVGILNKFVLTTGYGMLLKNVINDNLSDSVISLVYSSDNLFFGCGINSVILEDIYSENCYLLNFGTKMFKKKLLLGTNFKMYQFKYIYDEYYINDVLAQQDVQQIYDVDFGVGINFAENMNLGFTINNISLPILGEQIKYRLAQKFNLSFGYLYGITLVNLDVFYQQRKVDINTFSDIGYKIVLNQELVYTKNISCDVSVGTQRINNTTELNLSFQTRLFSNKIWIRYIWSYPVSDISGFIGNHYFMLTLQPQAGVKKRKVVKHEQPQEVEEIVVVKPKKKRVKKVVEEQVVVSTVPAQISYEIKPSTYEVKMTEELIKQTTVEIFIPQEKVVKKEVVYIKEEPVLKFPVAHKVKEGETLVSLAEKYYKNKKLWKKIYEVNKDKIVKGVPIVGEILVIPEP
jgi:nucleoid-associated protein YgaU